MRTANSTPPDASAFETFYQDVRGRLLLQTWALTGDLPAAQKAVRDSLVIAWHHWRKVSVLEDPQSYVRPVAWSRALRRATARPFHRERGFDEGIRATLAALAKLPLTQRRILLLAHLTTLPLDQIAREVGLPLTRTEAELQTTTARFAVEREIAPTEVLRVFEPMAAELREVRWPRTSILTRAGTGRRRLHTAIGASVALAAFVGAGVVATDSSSSGSRPSLHALKLHTPASAEPSSAYPLRTENLLSEGIVTNELTGQWSTELTSDNTAGDGLVLPCQRQRFADKSAQATFVRTLSSTDDRSVGQSVEVSRTAKQAHSAWTSALAWYAGCSEPRVQLTSTRSVSGVGDEANLVVLRDWAQDGRIIVAGVARTGVLTTTVVTAQPSTTQRVVRKNTDLLGLAVTKLCALPQAGKCAVDATTAEIPPIPVGKTPAMLGTIDLPPVNGVAEPWDATDPVAAKTNLAATRCDSLSFNAKGISGDLTRSFVIPAASSLPAQFGLTETIGTWANASAAVAQVKAVRSKLTSCPKTDLGTSVQQLESTSSKQRDVTVWRVTAEISDNRSVVYLMAITRVGTHIAQVGFVPDGTHTIQTEDFIALAHRAAGRLTALP
jgi:DNA-directed RNA polymerase specialized sigma24 family protein